MTDSIWSRAMSSAFTGVLAAAALAFAHAPGHAGGSGSGGGTSGSTSSIAPDPGGEAGALADSVTELLKSRATVGRDISWPNCPPGMGIAARPTEGKPLPPASARFVLVGLTNGPAFYPNPCLRQQVQYAETLHLWTAAYAVVTYPVPRQLATYGDRGPFPAGTRAGRLSNTGYAQAEQNVAWMKQAGLESPIVWLDVETVRPPAPWSGDLAANRAVVEGAMRGYRDQGLQIGVYSTQYLFRGVVGDVAYGLPEWRTAGRQDRAAALAMCHHKPIQGGPAVVTQWYTADVDFDALCPGRPGPQVLAKYFSPH
jgi:hypothetical protein